MPADELGVGSSSAPVRRASGRSALVLGLAAALVGIPAALLLAVAGFLGGGWNGVPGPGIPSLLVVLHESLPGLYAHPDASFLNRAYGRVLLLVFVGLLAGAVALSQLRAAHPRLMGAVTVGLALNALGNVADYWLGQTFNEVLWRTGFALGTMLGMLITLVASSVLGVRWWREDGPRWAAGALALVLPLAVTLTLTGVKYMPSGMVVPLCAAWGLTFAWALRSSRSARTG